MKHVKYADKSVLMGDDAADTLLEYARVLGDSDHTNTISLNAISPDGNTVEAAFLLNSSTVMMVETTNSEVEPPDNTEAVTEMRQRIAAISQPAQAETNQPWTDSDIDAADQI